jgi:hypothetical protein
MKKLFLLLVIGIVLSSCQTSTNNKVEVKPLLTTFNFKWVLYTSYTGDDGGWLPHTGTITINETKFVITTNQEGNTVTDSPIIKKISMSDEDYLYKTNMGDIRVNMEGNSIKDISVFSTDAMATFALENYQKK